MANRYTITKNVYSEYEQYIIDQRVINGSVLVFKEWLMSMIVDKKKTVVKKESNKLRFLEFVNLTQEEYALLIGGYGINKVKAIIERLNNYIGSKGDKYKSHYHAILTWFDKNGDKKTNNQNMSIPEQKKEEKPFIPMTEEEKIKAREIMNKARQSLLNK